jgi:DNA-binding MarR family transcriptional regulator
MRSELACGGPRAWSRYRDNVARHLIGISRDLESRLWRALSEDRGHRQLRPSFGPILSTIWDEGRTLSVIAGELGISNQACSQVANLAERAGYLERRPNLEDRRSKLVTLTPRGRELVQRGIRIILETETEYVALVGLRRYRRFTSSLAALYRGLDLPAHVDPALVARASTSIGVLPPIAVRVQRELMQATLARGHVGLKMSHGQVLPFIGSDGGRIHEIARIHQVSRQAISATSRDLEDLGYLRREPDPRDRRGVVLRLTDRGTRLIGDSVAALDELERAFCKILGDARLDPLAEVARDLYQSLHLEEEVFEVGRQPEPSAMGSSQAQRGGNDIQGLATRLRSQLGRRDAARLAALLEPRATRKAT